MRIIGLPPNGGDSESWLFALTVIDVCCRLLLLAVCSWAGIAGTRRLGELAMRAYGVGVRESAKRDRASGAPSPAGPAEARGEAGDEAA